MTAEAIFEVTEVLRTRLAAVLGRDEVYVGPPNQVSNGSHKLSLFLFQVTVNQAMRNEPRFVTDPHNPAGPLVPAEALPLDLRYLLSVFRTGGGGDTADANELNALGQAVQALHAQPFIKDARISVEPYSVEELSKVWGLFPQTSYRTSVVYLVSPVFVELVPETPGKPVLQRTSQQGVMQP
jgi:hypothetical protein